MEIKGFLLDSSKLLGCEEGFPAKTRELPSNSLTLLDHEFNKKFEDPNLKI